MNHRLSILLRETRVHAGLTQEDVASRIGLKKNTLSNYENGVSEPNLDTLVALFCIYDLDPAYVFSVAYGTALRDGTLSPEEAELIDAFRQSDSHGKRMIHLVAEAENDRMTAQKDTMREVVTRIAARDGGVFAADETERTELSALYAYLKEEGRLP